MHLPPFYAELPYRQDSSLYFEAIRNKSWPVFLDSASSDQENARFDIMTADPFITLVSTEDKTTIDYKEGGQQQSTDDPFQLLQSILHPFQQQIDIDLPFCGGALGYFSYDLGRRIESLPSLAIDAESLPTMLMGIYDWAIIVDHQLQRCYLASFGLHPQTHDNWDDLIAQLSNPNPISPSSFSVSGKLEANLDKAHYTTAFNKIKHYINEGDCYQVNLAKRFEIEAHGDSWQAYKCLRQQNSAPFSAFFDTPYASLLSSSPERLLQLNGKQVETKPIKGTRPRDLTNEANDRALADDLMNSHKDRAENLMIVDLLRNDLGKVCEPGSIKVPNPFALESFATVHHLVSTITGKLSSEHSSLSLLRACFPGGSITGAPKLRSMEIIEELEPHRRGIYCGTMAYIGFNGHMDSNILIRTLVFSDNRLRLWAGGGIVADSNVDDEYQEVHDKAAVMLNLIEQFR